MGYNFASAGDICEIVASMGCSGLGRQILPTNFSPTDPCCYGNKIWDKRAIIRIL